MKHRPPKVDPSGTDLSPAMGASLRNPQFGHKNESSRYELLTQRISELEEENRRLVRENSTYRSRPPVQKLSSGSERDFRRIVNSMPMLVWSSEPDGMMDFFNDRYLAYAGVQIEDHMGEGWSTSLHPEDVGWVRERWGSLIASDGDDSFEAEVRWRHHSGCYRWFLVRACALRDDSGKIVKWYGTCVDIHDRKCAEEQIRISEASLAAAQRLGRVGSFSWKVTTNEMRWSDELRRILGYEAGTEMTFEHVLERVHPSGRHYVRAMMNQEAFHLEHENRLIMGDGSERILSVKIDRLEGAEGQVEYLGAVADITEQRCGENALAKARADLAVAVRAASMGEMAAAIAHEVSQPLMGVLTGTELSVRMLTRPTPGVSDAVDTLKRVIRDGNRASDVIHRLRRLFSHQERIVDTFDFNAAVREVMELSKFELQRAQIAVREDLYANAPIAHGDRTQLQQVMLNLLRNAIESITSSSQKSMPRQIVIRTVCTTENFTFSIEDSGAGFDPETAKDLFRSFFTTKPNGMGIGLSVSQRIVQIHQGSIWGRNLPGVGAVFGFDISNQEHTTHLLTKTAC